MSTIPSLPALQVLGMTISNLDEALRVAEFFSKSDLVPKDYVGKPANIVVAWQKGFEVGLQPAQALESIAVINGRACIWGDAALALVRASGLLADFQESDNGHTATCIVQRKGEKPITQTFSMDDAKTAGLAGKTGPWSNYPRRMRQMRARGFGLRDGFPDVLKGLAIAEEAGDMPPIDVTATNTIPRKLGFTELKNSVEKLGLSLSFSDGKAFITSGNAFDYGKTLREIGFYVSNQKWLYDCEDDRNIVETTVIEPQAQTEEAISVGVPDNKTEECGLMALLPEATTLMLEELKISVSTKENGGKVYYQVNETVSEDTHETLKKLGFQNKGDKGWILAIQKEPTQGSLIQ